MSEQLQLMLRRTGMLSVRELDVSLREATARNISLWDLLVGERRVSEEALTEAFSQWLNVPRVRIAQARVDPVVIEIVPGRIVRRHTCLPLRLEGRHLILAMANPMDHRAIRDVEVVSSRTVQPVVASRSEILKGIADHYPQTRGDAVDPALQEPSGVFADGEELDLSAVVDPPESGASAAEMCSLILRDAIALRASDIHIEPASSDLGIRLRVDGVLRDHDRLPRWMHAALVSRIKVLAGLDISQKRLPQDGRIRIRHADRRMDVRVSTLPTHFGEKIVMRLLGSQTIPSLTALGFSASETARLDEALNQPQGLILVTGPTGAGKSTTLYSMLSRRQSSGVNIVTIEDPIEYQRPGLNQVQVDVKAGLTFANSLRAVLRQDPDVILVGEIRDQETAEIAVQAALTGHLVLSTLHTNSSIAAIERLLDLDVRPLVLASATNLIVAQRLARRVCTACRVAYTPPADALSKLRMTAESAAFVRGMGCVACGHTGYNGRIAIVELLTMTRPLKALIERHAPEADMRIAAAAAGTSFLLEDACAKVREGLTTVEEVLRVIRFEGDDLPSPAPLVRRISGPPAS
jgi:type IV pilus assembly protein PilB